MGLRHTFFSGSTTQASSTDVESQVLPAQGFKACKVHIDTQALSSGNFTVSLMTRFGDEAWQEIAVSSSITTAGAVTIIQANAYVAEADIFGDLMLKLNLSAGSAAGARVQANAYLLS